MPPASEQSGTCAQTPVQPQVLGWFPPPQLCGAVQLPQEMVLPQPSPIWPQLAFWSAHVSGAHASDSPVPHLLGPPAPQDCPLGHFPHWMTPPHFGSVTGPQFAFSSAHVDALQPASGKFSVPVLPRSRCWKICRPCRCRRRRSPWTRRRRLRRPASRCQWRGYRSPSSSPTRSPAMHKQAQLQANEQVEEGSRPSPPPTRLHDVTIGREWKCTSVHDGSAGFCYPAARLGRMGWGGGGSGSLARASRRARPHQRSASRSAPARAA